MSERDSSFNTYEKRTNHLAQQAAELPQKLKDAEKQRLHPSPENHQAIQNAFHEYVEDQPLGEKVQELISAEAALRYEQVTEANDPHKRDLVPDDYNAALQIVAGLRTLDTYTGLVTGALGFARMNQVDTNTELKEIKASEVPKPRRDQVQARLASVANVYSQIDTDVMRGALPFIPQQTVHGDPIRWRLERTQDEVKTFALQGNVPLAIQIAELAIRDPEPDIGGRSAQAVLSARIGQMNGSAASMLNSLSIIQEVKKRGQRNAEREATLAKWSIQHSLSLHTHGSAVERFKLLAQGVGTFIGAAMNNPKTALKVIR